MGVVVSCLFGLQLSGGEAELGADRAQNPCVKRSLVSCVVIGCLDLLIRAVAVAMAVGLWVGSLSVRWAGALRRRIYLDGQCNG